MRKTIYLLFLLLFFTGCSAQSAVNNIEITTNLNNSTHTELIEEVDEVVKFENTSQQSVTENTVDVEVVPTNEARTSQAHSSQNSNEAQSTLQELFTQNKALNCNYDGVREFSGQEYDTEFEVYITQEDIKTITKIPGIDSHTSIMKEGKVFLALNSDSILTGIPQMLVDSTGCDWLVIDSEEIEIDTSMTFIQYEEELDQDANCAPSQIPSFAVEGKICSLSELQNIFG